MWPVSDGWSAKLWSLKMKVEGGKKVVRVGAGFTLQIQLHLTGYKSLKHTSVCSQKGRLEILV